MTPARHASVARHASLVALLSIVLVLPACGYSTKSQKDQASAYITKHADDMKHVRNDVLEVQVQMAGIIAGNSAANANTLALTAQKMHDDLAAGKDNLLSSGDSGKVGDAETSVWSSVNDLKNAMGSLVAWTGNPNPATLADVTLKMRTATTGWNQSVTYLYTTAGIDKPPTV